MAFEAYLQGDVLLIWRIMARHTPKSLLSEDHGFAPTASEEAMRINSDTGLSMVTDQEFWEESGIVTGEELAMSMLKSSYSDLYKSVNGIRPNLSRFETIDDISDALHDLDRYANEVLARDEADLAEWQAYEKERQELAALMPTELELQYDPMPQYSGMGRRNEGTNVLKITKRQLIRIIREAIIDRSTMPAREVQEHPPWEPIQHSQWPAEQVSDDRNLQVEVEWEEGGRDVITLPPDVVADFDEEIETDRWAVDDFISAWLQAEVAGPDAFVGRWSWVP